MCHAPGVHSCSPYHDVGGEDTHILAIRYSYKPRLAVQFGRCAALTLLQRLNCLLTDFGTETKPKSSRCSVEVPRMHPPHARLRLQSSSKTLRNWLSPTSFTASAPSWYAPRHVDRDTSLPSLIFITPSRPTTITTRVARSASGRGHSEKHTSLVYFRSSNDSESA